MKTMSNCSNGVAAASIPMLLTSLPSTNDYRNLSSERSARPLHDAYVVLEPAPPVLLYREQRRYARELWHALSPWATDQQQHCRVRGEPGGQPSHGEEATNAMDGRGSALSGAGQSRCSRRRILG